MPFGQESYGPSIIDQARGALQLRAGLSAFQEQQREQQALAQLDATWKQAGGDPAKFKEMGGYKFLSPQQAMAFEQHFEQKAEQQRKLADEAKARTGFENFTRAAYPMPGMPATGGPSVENARLMDTGEAQTRAQRETAMGLYDAGYGKEFVAARMKESPEAKAPEITQLDADKSYLAVRTPQGIQYVPNPAYDPDRVSTGSETPGGATGYLVDRVMKEDPSLTYRQALQLVQTGFRQGIVLNPDNTAAPMSGYGPAMGVNRYGEKSGEQRAVQDYAAGIEGEKVRGKTEQERRLDLPKQGRVLEEREMAAQNVYSAIDRAAKQASGLTTTGFLGGLTKSVWGTPAHKLLLTTETIKANIGFDKLQQLRRDSPTGGALGQVSDFENKLLQAVVANLEQSQGREQFLYNLGRVKQQYNISMTNLARAYQEDLQRFGPDAMRGVELGSGPRKIASDQEYDALPSGSEFVGPDGKRRRKP